MKQDHTYIRLFNERDSHERQLNVIKREILGVVGAKARGDLFQQHFEERLLALNKKADVEKGHVRRLNHSIREHNMKIIRGEHAA